VLHIYLISNKPAIRGTMAGGRAVCAKVRGSEKKEKIASILHFINLRHQSRGEQRKGNQIRGEKNIRMEGRKGGERGVRKFPLTLCWYVRKERREGNAKITICGQK